MNSSRSVYIAIYLATTNLRPLDLAHANLDPCLAAHKLRGFGQLLHIFQTAMRIKGRPERPLRRLDTFGVCFDPGRDLKEYVINPATPCSSSSSSSIPSLWLLLSPSIRTVLKTQSVSKTIFLLDHLHRQRTSHAKNHKKGPLPPERIDYQRKEEPPQQLTVRKEVESTTRSPLAMIQNSLGERYTQAPSS